MSGQASVLDEKRRRPLAGARAWLITSGKAGEDTQVKGVAEALGLDYGMKRAAPTGLFKLASPWGPVDPKAKFGASDGPFAPPWPAVAIASGRLSIPYIKALRKRAGPGTYTVVLQDPRTAPATADLICVPAHDRRRGTNVFTTLTAPHGFSPERLADLKKSVPAEMAALPRPWVAVILGGRNKIYKFSDADHERFVNALQSLGRLGASFLVTPSRRTHPELLAAAKHATEGFPRLLWDGDGPNPYPAFLAHADCFVVTADSVNMTGEACATGKPVLVFEPAAVRKSKFARFHEALRSHGATRVLPDVVEALPGWSYAPLNSARLIADEIERRWARRAAMLGGIVRT